jgi:hypothetical protein
MKRIVFIIYILFYFISKQQAQNLIRNGSFENTANVDCYGGFYNGITPNAHVLDYWYQFNSPDYFNSLCGAGGYSVPKGYFGYSTAKNGNAYVGVSLYQGVNSEYKEYFYQQLQSPLVAGDIYCLNFFITRADRKEYAVKQIGAYFSNTLPTLVSFSYINAIPQVENQGNIITDTTQWIQMQGCFTAQGGEQYVTFGNFHDNAHTDTLNAGTNDPIVGDPKYSYYYIDDITLINQSTVGVYELDEANSFEIYPNPTNSILNIKSNNQQLQNATIEIKNTLGQIVYFDVYAHQINISDLPSGIYFITLNNKETKRTIKFVKD